MKIKGGKLILNESDIQVGNFVLSIDDDFIYIQDINGIVSIRLRKLFSTEARYLELLLKHEEENQIILGIEFPVMYLFLTTVKDSDCIKEIINSLTACINRHKDMFNIKENLTNEENNQITNNQKEFYDAIKELSLQNP